MPADISSFSNALQGRADAPMSAGHTGNFMASAATIADHCRNGALGIAADLLHDGGLMRAVAADGPCRAD